jgi:hypothetical protein
VSSSESETRAPTEDSAGTSKYERRDHDHRTYRCWTDDGRLLASIHYKSSTLEMVLYKTGKDQAYYGQSLDPIVSNFVL